MVDILVVREGRRGCVLDRCVFRDAGCESCSVFLVLTARWPPQRQVVPLAVGMRPRWVGNTGDNQES